MMKLLATLFWFATAFAPSTAGNIPSAVHVSMTRPGDVILGASLPIHGVSEEQSCSSRMNNWGNELVALLEFTINGINERKDLLPNITIGFDIRDNCYSDSLSIWTALGLASSSEKPQEDIEFKQITPPARGNLLGIIGTHTSGTTIPTTQAASLYRIPVISPFATSNELSSKIRFPYFLRTVPPDNLQASAIADILLQFGWKYIGLYFQLNTYGIHGAQALLDLVEELDICIAFSVPVRSQASKAELHDAVDKISSFPKAKVVVMFMFLDVASSIINTIDQVIASPNITYLGSDAWAYPLSFARFNVKPISIQGSISVQLKYNTIPDFGNYYRSLILEEKPFSPWFSDFKDNWMQVRDCTDLADCPIVVSANDNFVVDAVYAFAYALQDMLLDRCNGSTDCNSVVQAINGHDFFPYLLNVKFKGLAGNYSFDANGNPGGKYKILNAQILDNALHFVQVGEWHSSDHHFFVDASAMQWVRGSKVPPTSLCREECKPGFIEEPLEEKCCFGCRRCPDNAVTNGTSCELCPQDEWPDASFEQCHPIVPTPPNWADPTIIAILILSGLGLGLSLLAAFGLFHYRRHVLIKAASRELSGINILGLTLAFLAPFPLLVPPTSASCRASEVIVAMCFVLTYAPTLLKVNRIYRIFEAGKKSNKRPRFIGPRPQLMIVLGVVAGMIVVAIAGAIASPTVPAKLYIFPLRNYIEAYCEFGNGFLVSIICNLLLVLVCCYYAFKTRKVPSNYNESKFIAISVYSTLVFGMAAVPVYITAANVLQKVSTLCVAILVNAFLTLFCVYLPKLYAIQSGTDVEVCEWKASSAVSSSETGTNVSSGAGGSKVKSAPADNTT